MSADKVKIEGEVDKDTVARLRWLAERDGVSLAEAIDKAVANTVFLTNVVESGGKVLTEDSKGKFTKVTLR